MGKPGGGGGGGLTGSQAALPVISSLLLYSRCRKMLEEREEARASEFAEASLAIELQTEVEKLRESLLGAGRSVSGRCAV